MFRRRPRARYVHPAPLLCSHLMHLSRQPPVADVNNPASALALDEQLARQLALEDEREVQRHTQHRSQYVGDRPPRASGQTWDRRGAGAPSTQQEGGKGDFQQDFSETVNKLAESGKRTFSSIVSKVKAKISEMDQNRYVAMSFELCAMRSILTGRRPELRRIRDPPQTPATPPTTRRTATTSLITMVHQVAAAAAVP